MSASVVGAALLIGGFSAFGALGALRQAGRVRLYDCLVNALDYIQAEISFGLAPLPEIFAELSRQKNALTGFWTSLMEDWRPGMRLSEAWDENIKSLDIKERDRALTAEIGRILGRYDAERQSLRLEHVKRSLDKSLAEVRDESRKNGRLFLTMGIVCGLTAVIMLI